MRLRCTAYTGMPITVAAGRGPTISCAAVWPVSSGHSTPPSGESAGKIWVMSTEPSYPMVTLDESECWRCCAPLPSVGSPL